MPCALPTHFLPGRAFITPRRVAARVAGFRWIFEVILFCRPIEIVHAAVCLADLRSSAGSSARSSRSASGPKPQWGRWSTGSGRPSNRTWTGAVLSARGVSVYSCGMSRSSWHRSGTWLVAGMFGVGILLTAILFVYSWHHTAPFREMAAAIEAQYPDSSPRVEGGKPRLDRPGEMLLRVTMRAPFDPEDQDRATQFAEEVARLVATRKSLHEYGAVEVHLFYCAEPEALSQRSIRMNVEELRPAAAGASER